MKKRYLLITILLLFLAKSFAQEKTIKNAEPYLEKLKAINNELADAFVNRKIDVVMKYYDNKEPTCMPEYHKALYTKQGIQYYYQQWFNNVAIRQFKRDIYELQLIKNHLIEIGTFVNNFAKPDGMPFNYEGKYMNVWRIEKNGNLTLISEIWGSNSAVDKSNFSFIEQQASVMPKVSISKTVAEEIGKRNELIAKLVKKRQGEKHAELYTSDAIYLTYDMPMLVGMENIKPYFIEHEKTNDVVIDVLQIRPSTMINLDHFVLEYGYYYVEVLWGKNKEKTTVTGKSTNLWKRDENGIWMLYRQMVNHD